MLRMNAIFDGWTLIEEYAMTTSRSRYRCRPIETVSSNRLRFSSPGTPRFRIARSLSASSESTTSISTAEALASENHVTVAETHMIRLPPVDRTWPPWIHIAFCHLL